MSHDEDLENKKPEEKIPEATPNSGALKLQFPADPIVISETEELLKDSKIRVDALSNCISKDPIIVMELIKIVNSTQFATGRTQITAVSTAIVKIGMTVFVEMLRSFKTRPDISTNGALAYWYEVYRDRAERASEIAKIIASVVAPSLMESAKTSSLFLYTGDMLAVIHLKNRYVAIADEYNKRSQIRYRLMQDQNFDTEKLGLQYLRVNGIPEDIIAAIDIEGQPANEEIAKTKYIVLTADEMIEAYDTERWEKLAPGAKIPPKSAIRMLRASDTQYEQIYSKVGKYLAIGESQAEHLEDSAPAEAEKVTFLEVTEEIKITQNQPEESKHATELENKKVQELSVEDALETSTANEVPAPAEIIAPPVRGPDVNKVEKAVDSIADMIDSAENCEEMLNSILELLIENGAFKRSALIVLDADRSAARIVASRGDSLTAEKTIKINDPLSPLARCFSKVVSQSSRDTKASPFGSKSFAISPLDTTHQTPVALYADCGDDSTMPFFGRRVFRQVVSMLNEVLKDMPGAIPGGKQ